MDLEGRNISAEIALWEAERRIFSVEHDGERHFPKYAPGPQSNFQPYPVAAKIIAILRGKDGWGIAYWFGSLNSYLGGSYPRDFIAPDTERVIDATNTGAMGITHG